MFVLTSLAIAAIVVLAHRRFDWTRALRRHPWLLMLLAYMLISTVWSESTFLGFKRWARQDIVVPMALVIMSEANPLRALESLLRRSAYILIPFSFPLIKYYPALGRRYGRWSGVLTWTGVTAGKNVLGWLCMIVAVFLIWALYRDWRRRARVAVRQRMWGDVCVLVIAVYLLRGAEKAYSATALGSLALAITIFMVLRWFQKRKRLVPQAGLLAFVVILIALGISAPFVGGANLAFVSPMLGRDQTLTGRTELWAELVPLVKRQPVLGCGFLSFWTVDRRAMYFDNAYAHNGYLDILLELGAVGLALYTAWLLSCARKLHHVLAKDYDWASLAICFLVVALVVNVTESAFRSMTELMTAVFTLVSLVVPYDGPRRPRKNSVEQLRPSWESSLAPSAFVPLQ